MNDRLQKIALGGGCHWCTEAVFLSLKGVEKVEQGYVASVGEASGFSEAIVIHFNEQQISLNTLIKIHLYTHRSTSQHSFRDRYRSAIYIFSKSQQKESTNVLLKLQNKFEDTIITKVLPFNSFKPSREAITNYFYKNPEKPFCSQYIAPKLKILLEQFSDVVDGARVAGANVK